MASIGRFTASFIAGTQELTAGLANINFDFSMVKISAPPEYNSVGKLLSRKRKSNAEEGSLHKTARKLGALFQEDLPQVPLLVKAYGLRASEIAEHPLSNPDTDIKHGALDDYVGFDGATIWAAATSGSAALQSHLLGCLIARAWSPSRAFAIWREFVDVRRAKLKTQLTGEIFSINTITAAQLDFSDSELIDWDASARAWLQMADNVKMQQRKQLMLIVDNLGSAVKGVETAYDGVYDTWTKSMEALDKLIAGQPIRIQSPEILLGLTAWHIFPDISYAGQEEILIRQRDHLVASGGLLTLGIQTTNPRYDGINWTLPLAHLRYYGKTKPATGSIATTSIHVPFDTLISAVLGSATSQWRNLKIPSIVRFFMILGRKAHEAARDSRDGSAENRIYWPTAFLTQAERYVNGTSAERRDFERTIALGARRFANFMAEPKFHPPMVFGLNNVNQLMVNMTIERKIALWRHLASLPDPYNGEADLHKAVLVLMQPDSVYNGGNDSIIEIIQLTPGAGLDSQHPRYRRWILLQPTTYLAGLYSIFMSDELREGGDDSSCAQYPYVIDTNPTSVVRSTRLHLTFSSNPPLVTSDLIPSRYLLHAFDIIRNSHDLCGFAVMGSGSKILLNPFLLDVESTLSSCRKYAALENSGRSNESIHWDGLNLCDFEASWNLSNQSEGMHGIFTRLHTNLNTSVFSLDRTQREPTPGSMTSTKPSCVTVQALLDILESGLVMWDDIEMSISRPASKSLLTGATDAPQDALTYFQSLEAFSQIAQLYQTLSHASVCLAVLSIPLRRAQWLRSTFTTASSSTPKFSRETSLACIAMFDSGYLNLVSQTFANVIGVASGNTLYISEVLLNDPWACFHSFELCQTIRCIVGNIAKPGISFLISTPHPDLCETDLNSWQLVNHTAYEGISQDNFKSTSLQLMLTGGNTPFDTGEHGVRGKDVFWVEYVISAYEYGNWVGDVDVLQMYRSSWTGLKLLSECTEHTEAECAKIIEAADIRCVDNWAEFSDRPLSACVVRANNNWVARLAIAATAFARGDCLYIASGQFCWQCVAIKRLREELDVSGDKRFVDDVEPRDDIDHGLIDGSMVLN